MQDSSSLDVELYALAIRPPLEQFHRLTIFHRRSDALTADPQIYLLFLCYVNQVSDISSGPIVSIWAAQSIEIGKGLGNPATDGDRIWFKVGPNNSMACLIECASDPQSFCHTYSCDKHSLGPRMGRSLQAPPHRIVLGQWSDGIAEDEDRGRQRKQC